MGKVTVGGATPAILMVLVVFALPTRYRFWPFQAMNKVPESSPSLINWKTIETKLPWGVIILLGGGFAVSDACTKIDGFGGIACLDHKCHRLCQHCGIDSGCIQ